MKTACRILGSAFFIEGFEVQDAPRYGAERRGAPIFAGVRADRYPVHERGMIRTPDLVVVGDKTLAAGVISGCGKETVVLIRSTESAEYWKEKTRFTGCLLTFSSSDIGETNRPADHFSTACAGAAAGLFSGVVGREAFEQAVLAELETCGDDVVAKGREMGLKAYDYMKRQGIFLEEGREVPIEEIPSPDWCEVELMPASVSAPAIHAPATSKHVLTGLWRTMRPEIDTSACAKCCWNCTVSCPDSVIHVGEDGYPVIDYRYCKGCLVCAAQCPRHAIHVSPENHK